MKYQLISSGRLVAGAEKKESIAQIQRITKLSTEQVEKSVLNGKPKKLLASNDKEKIKRAALALRKAGLEVKVKVRPASQQSLIEAQKDGPGTIAPNKEKGPPEQERIDSLPPSFSSTKKKSRFGHCLISFLLFLVILISGAIGYGWYWLYRPLPKEVAAAEQALFDGNLAVAGLVDIKKIRLLERYWFGEFDPKSIPLATRQQGLLSNLLSGPANFRDNLTHILYAASNSPDQPQGTQLMLLAGKFDRNPLLNTLEKFFRTTQINTNRWELTPLISPDGGAPCPDNISEAGTKKFFIHITPDWLMVFTDVPYVDSFWVNLSSGQQAKQDLALWQSYRKGKLISFMVLKPAQAGNAIGGAPGMMARGALSSTPQVKEIALGLEAHPLKGGLNANLHLNSTNASWSMSTASEIQKKIAALQQDSRSITPTFANLLSRIKPTGAAEGLDIDIRVDSQLLHDLGNILQEGLSSLFMGMSGGTAGGKKEGTEEINENPTTYQNINLTELPDYTGDQFQSTPPLFVKGPFAVDLKSITPDDAGVMKIWLEGKVQLPENISDGFNTTGELSIQVSSIQDASGQELLRDERCMSPSDLFGQSPNHEPETNGMQQQGQGWVWKHVRLKPDTPLEQLHKITGEIHFSIPTQVHKISVPLQAGEVVEQGGVRFYLSSIKKNSISYQVSGSTTRLLEIRGINKAGQVLQQGWLMNNEKTGRATQAFTGQIDKLELIVAENIFEQKTVFELTDLFQTNTSIRDNNTPAWFAPEKIKLTDWNRYKKINPKKIPINPSKDWHMDNKEASSVAEGSWPPIRLFISHAPRSWGNSPIAHLYFPQLKELPGVLSGVSYRIDEPAPKNGAQLRYHPTSYWYNFKSGEVIQKHVVQDKPFALNSFSLVTGLKDNQKLDRLKGELIFHLPKKTLSEKIALKELWKGQTKDGITVTLTKVGRGMFPGYDLKIEGDIEKLVNLHGIGAGGERVLATPVNFQEGGYWTMTLPFGRGIENIELVIATEQEVLKYPFDFKAKYPTE